MEAEEWIEKDQMFVQQMFQGTLPEVSAPQDGLCC